MDVLYPEPTRYYQLLSSKSFERIFQSTKSPKLKMLCASAIYRLAEEEESRDLVRMHGGLEPLVELVQDPEHQINRVMSKTSL